MSKETQDAEKPAEGAAEAPAKQKAPKGEKGSGQKGGITSVEAPLSVGKLMIICKKCGPTRIGYLVEGTTKKRVCRKCGGDL